MFKKGIELSFSTIIIFILAITVLLLAFLFLTKFGGPLIDAFKDRASTAINIVNQSR